MDFQLIFVIVIVVLAGLTLLESEDNGKMITEFSNLDDFVGFNPDALYPVLKAAQKEADLYGQEVNVYKRLGAFDYRYSRQNILCAGWELECSIAPKKTG